METLIKNAPVNCVINNGSNNLFTTDVDWKSKGFRMSGITGYGAKESLFAAIWENDAGNDYTFTTDMSPAEFQKVFNNLTKNEYFLHWVDGYNVNGQVRYAAIWEKKDPIDYIFRHGLASIQFYTVSVDYANEGYRPIHVTSYNNNGYPCYAAIWVRDNGPERIIKHNHTTHEFENQNRKLNNQGYYLTDLNGCCYNGEPTYSAIWEKNETKKTKYDIALRSSDFIEMYNNMKSLGYYPSKISGYDANNTNYFAVIWEEKKMQGE